jgi:hypothetical protein
MPIYDIDNPGQIGIIKDTPEYELPQNAWSDGYNVSFRDGKAIRGAGEQEITAVGATASAGYYITPVRTDASYFWVVCGSDNAYVTDLSTVNTIYTPATSATRWTSGFLQGILLLSNGADAPQSWVPGLSSTTTDLRYDSSSSTTWADVAASAKVVRTFGEYGVALDTTESGTRNSRRVWWSHPADAGNEPLTWDYSKAAFDAGQIELDDDPEPVVDCAAMRGDNLVYKYNSVHRMSYVGPPFIFSFSRIFNNMGIRSTDCVKEFYGRHAVFGFEDVLVHDGVNHQEILSKKTRRWLINNIDDSNSDMCCVAVDYTEQEIYFLFPEVGESFLTKALIWNYRDNTTTIRDLDDKLFAASGIVSPSVAGTTYAQDIGAFQDAIGVFDSNVYNTAEKVVAITDRNAKFSIFSDVNQVNDVDFTAFVERQGLPLPGRDGLVTNEIKFIRRLYPRITSSAEIKIQLASQMYLNGPIQWDIYTFDPTSEYKIDVRTTSRIPGIWIGSESGAKWELHGMGIEYITEGMR